MGVNKVEYGSSTLVDLTGDTVTPETLLQGETAHNAAGNRITGTARPGVQTFNGRSGSVLPIAGDYSAEQVNYDSNKTVKQVIDALATKEASDIAGQQSLIKDTVGWTGKNLLKKSRKTTITNNGITFVFNADGSVTFSGTTPSDAIAEVVFDSPDTSLEEMRKISDIGTDLILSGSDSADSIYCVEAIYRTSKNVYISDERAYNGDRKLTVPANAYYLRIAVMVKAGNTISTPTTVYPMLRKASITDPTYEPYHESVEVMYEEEIHGVNLLKNIATSRTINGVTFTVNADGSMTANGTATANAILDLFSITKEQYYKAFGERDLILNGCPSGGDPSGHSVDWSKYHLDIIETQNTVNSALTDGGDGVTIPASWFKSATNNINLRIRISSGQTVNNLVFKPMLRKADIEDSTYRPYNPQAIQNQLNAQGVLGAKNLLNIPDKTLTSEGVTVSINDGVASFSGTNALSSPLWIAVVGINIPKGTYIFNGLDTTQNIVTNLQLLQSGNIEIVTINISDSSKMVTIPNDLSNCKIHFRIVANGNTDGIKAYPMLRLASDPDDTYVPYAMTNRELTEKKMDAELTFVTGVSIDTLTENKRYYCSGNMTGLPTGNIGYLDVHRSHAGEGIHQTFYPAGKQGEIYVRRYWDNAWGSWYKFTGTVVS